MRFYYKLLKFIYKYLKWQLYNIIKRIKALINIIKIKVLFFYKIPYGKIPKHIWYRTTPRDQISTLPLYY